MKRTKSFSWAVVFGVIVSGCGPVAIRALDPAVDGGAATDVVSASDGGARCTLNSDCPTGNYCAGNGCGTAGTCAPKPQGCTADYSPVCGCDGRTYSNACGAAAGGARVATQGACGAVDAGPGGCTTNEQCGAGQFCAGTGCGTAGACVARPQVCTEIYAPVCGCDGRTYANECQAQGAGARIAAQGECAARDAGVDAGPARCTANEQCGAGRYCAGAGCGTAGTCAARPEACDLSYSPVCGCDGRTYGNDCAAAAGGARIARRGECAAQDGGTVSSCRSARDCGSTGRECVFPEGECGAVGTCELPTPCFRAETYCSCTGETYESCRPTQPTRSRGACASQDGGVATGCASARDCGSGQECVFPTSACGARGTCEAGIACLRAETFCGCNGVTYQGCRPSQPTQYVGACTATPPDAGAGCRDNSACVAGTYCAASACGGVGACAPRPEVCPGIYAPVCGCDGRTYSSACVAGSQGVNVARSGECP